MTVGLASCRAGFEHVPGGAEWANLSAFSYHYYCDTFVPSYGTKPFWRKVVCDDTVSNLVYKAVGQETRRLGGGAMMTEGLACDFSNNESASECFAVMAKLDVRPAPRQRPPLLATISVPSRHHIEISRGISIHLVAHARQ